MVVDGGCAGLTENEKENRGLFSLEREAGETIESAEKNMQNDSANPFYFSACFNTDFLT